MIRIFTFLYIFRTSSEDRSFLGFFFNTFVTAVINFHILRLTSQQNNRVFATQQLRHENLKITILLD